MLLPKKPKELIKPTADALNLNEELVNDVVNFYWSEIRKTLCTIPEPKVTLYNLGYFQIKFNCLQEVEDASRSTVKYHENPKSFLGHHLKTEAEKKIIEIESLKKKIQDDGERKKKIKDIRYGRKTIINQENLGE